MGNTHGRLDLHLSSVLANGSEGWKCSVGNTDQTGPSEKSHLCLSPFPNVRCRWHSVSQPNPQRSCGGETGRVIRLGGVYFFVLRCLSLQTSGFPLEWQVALPQNSVLSRRASTSSNTGVGYIVLLLSSFWWSVLFCVGPWGFCTSAPGLHLRIVCYPFGCLLITCRTRHFRVSFIFLGRFCRRLTLWNTSDAELLPYTDVQSDQLSPVERSGSRLFPCRYLIVHFSSTLFLHLQQEFAVFIFGVSSSHRRALWITLQTRERGEWLNRITLLCVMDPSIFTSCSGI